MYYATSAYILYSTLWFLIFISLHMGLEQLTPSSKINPELNCKWHFAKQLGGRDDGPNDPMSENFKRTPYASLIRESIQNSLDAVDDDSIPVRMSFRIKKLSLRNFPNLFGLDTHLDGCIRYFPQADENYKPMLHFLRKARDARDLYYIQVSDFNTTGMRYSPNDRESAFYGFVRAAGVSNKTSDTAGGSFGFGKAAYFYISPIRTILVSTLTDSGKYYFEGVASLCTHFNINDEKCVSVGYYDNNDGMPVDNPEDIPARFRRDEIGTDINIMGVEISSSSDKEDIYKEMVISVLQNFWLSIYHGKLDVVVGELEITEANIVDLVEQYFPDIHDTSRKKEYFNPRPYLEAVRFAGQDKNHRIYNETLPTLGEVWFYAYKNRDASARVAYLRSPRMMVDCKQQPSANGFYGVFFCENQEGDKILRRIENPAHDQWMPSNWKDERGKTNRIGRNGFREIKEFLIRCIEKLFERSNQETLNIRGLDQYLYIPTAIEDDDDDYMSEALVSNPTGSFKDEGASITTDGKQVDIPESSGHESIGKVLVNSVQTGIPDSKGSLLSGPGRRRGSNGSGVGAGKINRRNIPVESDGTPGTYASEIPVSYRSFAQKKNGIIVHNIIIHSDYEVKNGRIDLLVGTDQSDEVELNIVSANVGTVEGNSISGLHIVEGKNPAISIRFADDLPHSIKLDAYEIK